MSKQVVSVGTPQGPYSPGILAGGFCFVAGQGGLDPETGRLVEGGIGPETRQTLANVRRILEAAGYSLADVVQVNCFLADIAEWESMNEAYAESFADAPPARTSFAVGGLPRGIRIMVDAIAYRGD